MISRYHVFALTVAMAFGLLMLLIARGAAAGLL